MKLPRVVGALWRAALLAAVLLAVPACSKKGEEPLEFTVTFQDAEGLEPGQLLVYNGVRIGVVEEVKLDETNRVTVRVKVDKGHEGRVYREAEFVINKPGGMLDVSGERQLEMRDRTIREKTLVARDDIVKGTDGWLEQAKHRVVDFGRWAGGQAEALWGKATAWADSPEGQAFRQKLKSFADEAGRVSKEQWARFRDEHYPALREQALELKDKLERDGRLDEARELWDEFTRLFGAGPPAGEGEKE